MQKKILVIALCLLTVVFFSVACNKKDGKEPDTTYVPIDYTVGEDGEKYITNIYGDLIPVTTSKDGSMELLEDLVTKTKDQVEREKSEIDKANQENTEEPATGGDNSGDVPQTGSTNPQGGIQVGNEDIRNHSDRDAVLVW